MQAQWTPTLDYYQAIIDAPSPDAKQQLYRQYFIEPFRTTMQQLAPMFGVDLAQDDLAVARAWGWLLPDDLTTLPDVMQSLQAADAMQTGAAALAEAGARFNADKARIGIEAIEGWLILANPARMNPYEDGYTGAIDFFNPRLFAQYAVATARNIERLPALVVHEMHHIIRLTLFPWDMAKTSVADYIVHEGLAESFAKAMFGEGLVWDTIINFDAVQFETARQLIGAGLGKSGFNTIRPYIFGDEIATMMDFEPIGMPLYGGYAVGYRVVQAYLERTGQSIEAATFEPADVIVRESGFFA